MTITDPVRLESASTTNVSRAALSAVPRKLALTRKATYQVVANLSALQVSVAASWSLLGTFDGSGSGLTFNSPGQVAVDSSGNVYVADTANNRIIKLNSSGAYVSVISGLTAPTGVCVDASGNIYVVHNVSSLRKYNSAFVQQWSVGGASARNHIVTDGTHLYTAFGIGAVQKRSCATGGHVATFGSAGSGNGQFSTPYGIAVGGGEVYVVDAGNSRVQVLNTSGVYQRQWSIPASSRGIALDVSSDVWVAAYGSDELRQYTSTGTHITTVSQANADGIGVATGDVLWVANADGATIAKWDETGGGYGQVAVEINGDLGPYLGIGERVGAVSNVHTATIEGPSPLTVRAFGKATIGQMTLQALVLNVTATPDR